MQYKLSFVINLLCTKLSFLGMLRTNGSFLKSQKDSHPIVEVDEEAHTGKMQLQKSDGISISLSRDSLEPDGKK